jgi:hypothetical protein
MTFSKTITRNLSHINRFLIVTEIFGPPDIFKLA